MENKAKEIVKIRFRKLKSGEKSIYFDVYSKGIRDYLWQEERILQEKDDAAEQHNRDVMAKLEERRRLLIAELTLDKSGITDRSFNTDLTLQTWLENFREGLSGRARHSYIVGFDKLSKLLKTYNPSILIKDVDEDFVVSFYEYLKAQVCSRNKKGKLSEGYVFFLLKVLNSCMSGAIRQRYIDVNPCKGIVADLQKREKKRGLAYLTPQKLIKLIDTPYQEENIKRLFLFACFTGATHVTLSRLCWKDIYKKDGRTWVILKRGRREKNEDITVPLTEMAIACLPPRCRAKGSTPIFGQETQRSIYFHLKEWGKNASITIPLSYRLAKNTYASLLLNADADFYTAGYMMGFSDIKYMKEYEGYLNEGKRESVNKMDVVLEKIIMEAGHDDQ